MRIIPRPPVQLGLDLQYPPLSRTQQQQLKRRRVTAPCWSIAERASAAAAAG
jgi:hypothetical protein